VVEKVRYTVIKKIQNIEIREYPELILAFVENITDNNGFGLLFNYISGYNKINKKIKMTAPVINSERIEMTSPVISKGDFMAFIMPSSYNIDNIPTPLDSNVKIKTEPKRKLAVIRFGGYTNINKIKKYEERLFKVLKSNNIKIKGVPLLMRYNSPFAPPFIRRNEIGVEID
jgi:effector-binding domain-containing protein